MSCEYVYDIVIETAPGIVFKKSLLNWTSFVFQLELFDCCFCVLYSFIAYIFWAELSISKGGSNLLLLSAPVFVFFYLQAY